MNFMTFFIISLIVTKEASQKKTRTTLRIQDRVALLKIQIAHDIKKNRFGKEIVSPINNEDSAADYEYVDIDSQPITPIMDNNDRKRHEKFKLKEIKTTTEYIESFPSNRSDAILRKKKTRGKKKRIRVVKPRDIFYRRYIYETVLPFSKEWTHCQDLITPFYTGFKTNMTDRGKRITYDNHLVLRLAQLLSEDVREHTKDDIYSIMFQISNLQIRLFQWDIAAVKLLLNSINKEYAKTNKKHTFRSVKEGLKKIFRSWHLDFTNTTNLLKQARLFRPPCVKVTGFEGRISSDKDFQVERRQLERKKGLLFTIGSTKTSRSFRYTKRTQKRKKCSNEEQNSEDCY